jgi:DNA modification methylase
MLEGSAEPGFLVCDPFAGSGSAAIAALRNRCRFVGRHRRSRRGDGPSTLRHLPQ